MRPVLGGRSLNFGFDGLIGTTEDGSKSRILLDGTAFGSSGEPSVMSTTFLVGAGISIESGFPAAHGLTNRILSRIAPTTML